MSILIYKKNLIRIIMFMHIFIYITCAKSKHTTLGTLGSDATTATYSLLQGQSQSYYHISQFAFSKGSYIATNHM